MGMGMGHESPKKPRDQSVILSQQRLKTVTGKELKKGTYIRNSGPIPRQAGVCRIADMCVPACSQSIERRPLKFNYIFVDEADMGFLLGDSSNDPGSSRPSWSDLSQASKVQPARGEGQDF
jgi:hypothetical protein